MVITLATLMATMDTAIVIVALPSAQQALGMPDTARQWVVTAYTLAYGGLLLVGGRLADRLGYRRTLLAGATGFVIASAAAGAAINGPMLIAARAFQGAFGAILVPSARALITILFREDRSRAKAFGVFTAALITGAVVGFILSGLLASFLSWRWSLYVNVPIALAVWIGTLLVIPKAPGSPAVRIDVPSVVLGSGGLTLVVYGLSQAASVPWTSSDVALPLVLAVVSLVGFVVRQATAASPLLPLAILTAPARAGSFVTLALGSVGTFGMALILTYQLQAVMRYSPLATGAALVPFAFTSAFAAIFVGPKLMRFAPIRWLIASGLALTGIGLLVMSISVSASELWPIIAAELLLGLGTGLSATPSQLTVMRGVAAAQTGAASAMSSTSNQIGASVGSALLNSLAVSSTTAYLASHPGVGALSAAANGYAAAAQLGATLLLAGAVLVAFLLRDADHAILSKRQESSRSQ